MDRPSDRRAQIRVPLGENIHIMHNDRVLPPCHCIDISVGGAKLGTSLPVSSSVKLMLSVTTMSERRGFLVDGKVIWRRLNASGVRFTNLPLEARVNLIDLVSSRSKPSSRVKSNTMPPSFA